MPYSSTPSAVTIDAERWVESSLPAYATRFFDRERERADLAALLRSARAITVCGPGGVGKSRLAIEAAHALRGRSEDAATLIARISASIPKREPAGARAVRRDRPNA